MANRRFLVLSCCILALLSLAGCIGPLVVGGGAAVGTMAVRDKTLGETVTDNEITLGIQRRFYKVSPDLYSRVEVIVNCSEVVLTGTVLDQEMKDKAEECVNRVRGVKSVSNHIVVDPNDTAMTKLIKNSSLDTWITTKVKSKLLITENVKSINYTVTTVNQVVYITGLAQNKAERDIVLDLASRVDSVVKVMDYIKIKDDDA